MKTPGLPERVALLWRRAADVSRDAGAAFLVLALPEAENDPAPSTWLDHVLRSPRLGDVPVVDMAKRFRSKGFESRHLMLDAVGHLSPAGHRVTADVLEEVLVKRGLLPPRRRLAAGTRPDTHRTP